MDDDVIHKQIHESLLEGDSNKVNMLLKTDDVDVDFRDVTHDLQTALMKLCYVSMDITSLKSILETVFDKDPDVNLQDSWGRTALMHACISNKPLIIESLLEYEHTDVALTDFDGNSALSYAVQNCDIYTLEDILQHSCGPRLLTVHNSKGQTPVTIAEKSGDKSIIKLFQSHLDKTVGLQQKKKNRHRDAVKLKPMRTHAHTQERLAISSAPAEKTTDNKTDDKENKLLSRPKLNISKAVKQRDVQEKCDSAPVTRGSHNTFDKTNLITSLQLSSPRLQRRHHKENSLLEECFKRNNINILPPMKVKQDSDNVNYLDPDIQLPEHSIRRQRRPSISLPDLRSVAGCLVNSGSSTPNSDTKEEEDGHFTQTFNVINDDTRDDDVFSHTFPAQKHKLHKTSSRKSLNDVKVSLPDINKSLSKHDAPYSNKKSFQPLNRPRKFSSSDDQLHRTLAVNDNR